MTFASSKRVLAVLLLLCMVFGLLPAVAFADGDVVEEPVIEETAETVAEEAAAAEEIEVPDPGFEALTLEPETASVNAAATKYTLTINKNNGTHATTKSYVAGASIDLSTITATHSCHISHGGYTERYVLEGWQDSDGTNYSTTDIFVMPEKDITITAVWNAVEGYYWVYSIEGNGTADYSFNGPNYTLHEGDEPVKHYVNDNGEAHLNLFGAFVPSAAEGYVFDGWYISTADGEEKLDDYSLYSRTVREHKLTAAMFESGHNKIVGRFIKNPGNLATVKYEWPYNVKGFVVTIGSATPTIDDPTNSNLFFLGWDPAVAPTVTGDVTYTAKWLDGPTAENTVDPLFTIRCISGEGVNGTHADMTGNIASCSSNNDIAYDEGTGAYTCTVTGSNIGALLGGNGSSYDGTVHQEHHLVDASPIIHLIWDSSAEKWVPDGEQIVEVYHDFGDKEISFDELSKISRVICVVDSDNTDKYKPVKMLKNTYEITYAPVTGNNTRTAEVRITNFDAYAQQLSFLHQPDWENNFHPKEYYVFYMNRSLETRSFADGTTYYAWGNWKLDTENTTYQSIDPVIHNEALYGKELMAKSPLHTITFTDGAANGTVFEPVVFEDVALPYAGASDLTQWMIENVLKCDPNELMLDTGEYFCGWSPALPAPDTELTEDLVFEALWDFKTLVVYFDGISEEGGWGEPVAQYDYFAKTGNFPALVEEDGTVIDLEREDCIFSSWKSVEDPEATEYIVDEATGYTVNVYREEVDGVVYTDFAILLVADWTWDTDPVIAKVASLNLDGTIGVNYKVILPDDISETAEAVFLYKGNEYPVPVSSVEPDSRGYSAFTFNIPAAEFANTIALKFVDQGATIPFTHNGNRLKNDTLKYSAQKYAKNLSADSPSKQLVEMLQSYCYYAYLSLGKSAPDVLPTAITTTPAVSSVTAQDMYDYRNTGHGSITGITPAKISLNLESTTEINIKFEMDDGCDISDYSFELGSGAVVTPVQEGEKYVVTIPNIAAKDLDTMYTLTVRKGDEALVLNTSALAYCYTILSEAALSDVKLDVCRALYLYNQAANAYFGA